MPHSYGLGEVENRDTGLDSSRTFGMLQIPKYTSGTQLESVIGNQPFQNMSGPYVENRNQSNESVRDPLHSIYRNHFGNQSDRCENNESSYNTSPLNSREPFQKQNGCQNLQSDQKYSKCTGRTNGLLHNALTGSSHESGTVLKSGQEMRNRNDRKDGTENWISNCDDLKARENQNMIVDKDGCIVPEVRRGTIIQHMSHSHLKGSQSQSFIGSKYDVHNSNIAQDADPNCRYKDSQRKYIKETDQIQFDIYDESEWQRASHSNSRSPSHSSYELGKRPRPNSTQYRKDDTSEQDTVFKNLPDFSNIYEKDMHSVYTETNTSWFETDQNFESLHMRLDGMSSPKRQKLIHSQNLLTNPEKAYTGQRLAKENLNSFKSTYHKRDMEQSQPTKFHCLSLIENLLECNKLLDISNLYQVEKLFQTNTEGVAKLLCELGENVVEQLVLWMKKLRFFNEIPIQIYTQLLSDKWHELLVLITVAYKAINGETNKGMTADELYNSNMEKLKVGCVFIIFLSPVSNVAYTQGSLCIILSQSHFLHCIFSSLFKQLFSTQCSY